jgi:hypothetical protein
LSKTLFDKCILTILERYLRQFGERQIPDILDGFVVQLMAKFDIHLSQDWITKGTWALFILATYLQTQVRQHEELTPE